MASRFNVYDAHPYPYGFGVDKEDMWKFDETEPVMLVKAMIDWGARLASLLPRVLECWPADPSLSGDNCSFPEPLAQGRALPEQPLPSA